MDTPTRRDVVLIVETPVVYGRQILSGITHDLGNHGRWSVRHPEHSVRTTAADGWIRMQDEGDVLTRAYRHQGRRLT